MTAKKSSIQYAEFVVSQGRVVPGLLLNCVRGQWQPGDPDVACGRPGSLDLGH